MSLTSELSRAGSPITTFFDERLPNHRAVQAEWREHKLLLAVAPQSPRFRSEIGLAAGHLVVGLATGSLGWGVGEDANARALNWLLADALDELLRSPTPELRSAAQASWFAGLFDRVGRGFVGLDDPLLAPFEEFTSLEELFVAVPAEVVADLEAIASANIDVFHALPEPRIAGTAPSGAGWVGGADADLQTGPTVVEVKTIVDATLSREHLRQLIAYPLLDAENEWHATEVALWSLRYARLERWPLDDLLSVMASGPVTAGELRYDLEEHLVSANRLRNQGHRPTVTP